MAIMANFDYFEACYIEGMSRSKDPSRYPNFCYKTMQDLEDFPTKPKVILCKDKKEAHNLKFTWNCFKRAALDAGWANPSNSNFRGLALPCMVCRLTELKNSGQWQAEISNINLDDAVARWNEQVGCDPEEMPKDKEDKPAYAKRR